MENWLILSEFFTILYLIVKIFLYKLEYPASFVFFILFFICINILYYIVGNKVVKSLLLLFSMAILIVSYVYVNEQFILLLPFNLYEFSNINFGSPFYGAAFILLVTIFLYKSILPEYILVSFMGCVIYNISVFSYKKMERLKNQNDELRKSIYSLYNKIHKNTEYEKQVKYTAQLEERNKISQKIHDNIGHVISGSLMQLEAAKILIDKNSEHAKKLIQNTIDVLRDGYESIRIALNTMKPTTEQMGINRIKLMVDEFSAKSNIDVSFVYSGPIDKITYFKWNVIFENIKEALTNVLKHSKATKVTVSINVLNKFIKIEVKDNGIGATIIKKGLGLEGIEERSESIGGKVIIDGSNGFSVIVLLPLEGEKNGY